MIGIILAGGHSSRFVCDKALYYDQTNQQYWIERLYQQLSPLCHEGCYIVANANNQQPIQAILKKVDSRYIITDQLPFIDQGPLSALYAVSCVSATTHHYLIVAVDYPLMTTNELKKLVNQPNSYAQTSNGKDHYTVSYLTFNCPQLTDYLQTGQRHVRHFIDLLDGKPVLLNDDCLQNINTQEQLIRLQQKD